MFNFLKLTTPVTLPYQRRNEIYSFSKFLISYQDQLRN